MSDIQRIREMVSLEVLLFQGVPEVPNPVYGRDGQGHVHMRTTRTEHEFGAVTGEPEGVNTDGDLLGELRVDLKTGEVRYTRANPS